MRKVPTVVLLSVAVPAFSGLPVVSRPADAPHPVRPQVAAVALAGVDAGALASGAGERSRTASAQARAEVVDPTARGRAPRRPTVLTERRSASDFELLGVTWRAGTGADATVVVRTHGDEGWSEWTALDVTPMPEAAEGDDLRAGTEPLYSGPSDGYQVRVDVRQGPAPRDVKVELVQPGDSAADDDLGTAAPPASAQAAASRPAIYTRAQWGADERLRGSRPNYTSTIKAGFVHHTAGANGYSRSEVPKIIRGIYAYHTKANGWSDIGYNFLVDRFGRLWEGRYGGMDRAVLGAHTGGFNSDSFAVSAIGNYDTAAVSGAMVDAIARVLAWKLGRYYRDPLRRTTLTSSGGGTSRYSAGTKVRFRVISGHRNAGYTSCPGDHLYAKLGAIRNRTLAYMGASLVHPRMSASSADFGGKGMTARSGVLGDQRWRLEVREVCRDHLVRRLSGRASRGTPIAAAWDLRRGDGRLARPGRYRVLLRTWDADSSSEWSTKVTVRTAVEPGSVDRVAMPGPSTFVPVTPTRVYDSRRDGRQPLARGDRVDVPVTGRAGIPGTGVGSVVVNVTAVCASSGTYLTVWPAGRPRTTSSTLNVLAGGTRAATTVVAVGGGGSLSLVNARGFADVLVDVVGYHPTNDSGSVYHPTEPFRLYDSRSGDGALGKDETKTLKLPALDAVAPGAMTAAVVNVTAVGSSGRGHLRVHPAGTEAAGTSTLNFPDGAAVANRAVTGLSGGRLAVTASRATQLVVDVVGWYAPASAGPGGTRFHSIDPTRVMDTRKGLGIGSAFGPRTTKRLRVTGSGRPVPGTATAVAMTVTSTRTSASTYVTVWPSGSERPGSSDLNTRKGRNTANLVVARLGDDGRVSLYNRKGTTDLVGDVVGYFS